MRNWFFLAALLAAAPSPALADAGNFTVVNGTGRDISSMAFRRFGTEQWQPLGAAPAAGARAPVAFSSPDCAFDLRAELAGATTAIWSGVNLCEAAAVTLNRSASGVLWVDYD